MQTPKEPILADLNALYETMSAQEILRHAIEEQFVDRITIVSSFGAEFAILLHMIAEIDPTVPVIMLIPVSCSVKRRAIATACKSASPYGCAPCRWTRANWPLKTPRVGCGSAIRMLAATSKVRPQARAVAPFDALITGRKRFQTGARQMMDIVEIDTDGRYKVNPLANWQLDDLKAYIETHQLPRNPLVKDGYLSIGCMPCTQKVEEGGDYRSGRWAGSDKDECGIHLNIDGDGI